ncbi:unnamed protein product [Adineta steineri]|uniref:Alpha-1,4 glucan phosphorylase n=3 Tax=Adineta steineri TaxID=433720 RepID=A0A813SBZ4_9BILA|nr:unnamed protein product [Adineta steineri]
MSVGGGQKRRSRSSFVSVRYVPTDEEEELHRQKEAQNLRVSLHQIKNIETILNLVDNFNRHLHLTLMVDRFHSSYQEYYLALSQALRDILAKNWIRTQQFYQMIGGKRVYYLSLEFYIGRYMKNTLINLDINEQMIQAAVALNIKLNDIEELEDDAALGNGGLGRLAACFLDSMATLGISSYGYGLRYQFGIFKQQIVDGWQVEVPDDWLRHSMPWEIRRNQNEIPVHFYGKVIWNESTKSYEWTDYETVIAQAYDYPVPGYKNNIVNTMRLFSAKADCDFNFKSFNEGEYISAVMERNKAERITCVLYPNDNIAEGRELRLKQEYFLIAASLHDILRRFKGEKRWQTTSNLQVPGKQSHTSIDYKCMPEMVAIQLNDTHPSLAIPELMRLLLDNEHLSWDDAWSITVNCFAYTNHTLMPEAIERWPVQMIEKLLPRHLQIIYEINARHLQNIRNHFPSDNDRIRRMSIIEEGSIQLVNMAYLSIIGSHTINGVAQIHSKLLREFMFKDFYELTPLKFKNKTNGITFRRWLALCNPDLFSLIMECIGEDFIRNDYQSLQIFRQYALNKNILLRIQQIKMKNKLRLAHMLEDEYNIEINIQSIFDVQIKRIHEYKRALLCLLHAITLYNRLKKNSKVVPRTIIIGGKAAPGYAIAKKIIKLINDVADVINNDTHIGNQLKLLFVKNYRVTAAEYIIPAADLSEQISLAGTEASGTGNMKFMLNGALTIGTLDGANIEMLEECGAENMYTFGFTVEQVQQRRQQGYDPYESLKNEELRLAIDQIRDGYFSSDDRSRFHDIIDTLLRDGDHWMVLGDYQAYINKQDEVSRDFLNSQLWYSKCIHNIGGAAKFSSDRTIEEYAKDIWHCKLHKNGLPNNIKEEFSSTNHEQISRHNSTDSFTIRDTYEEQL